MIDKVQTIGLTAKGIVYAILGILTALTAFDMGGSKMGKSGVIDFLQKQPLGKFILIAMSVGILAYALWRLYTAFFDPEEKGDDAAGIGKRIGYGIYGLIYLSFAVAIFKSVLGSNSGGGGKQHYASVLMDKSYGPYIVGLIGVIVICVGIYEFYKGYLGKYMEGINVRGSGHRQVIEKTGKFGYMARGVVLGIIGYFFLRAGVTQNSDMVRGTQGAFSFLQQQSWGSILMGVVAIGLIGYGVFSVLKGLYSTVTN